MALQPFMGEIRAISFNFAPKGWVLCNGQILQIQQYQALFSIIGTTYGGDGVRTFALPDLRSRVPIAAGPSDVLGSVGGASQVTLLQNQIGHSHAVTAAATANTGTANGNFPAAAPTGNLAYGPSIDTTMAQSVVQNAGGGNPHNNMQPYLVINYAIALVGIFPSRT